MDRYAKILPGDWQALVDAANAAGIYSFRPTLFLDPADPWDDITESVTLFTPTTTANTTTDVEQLIEDWADTITQIRACAIMALVHSITDGDGNPKGPPEGAACSGPCTSRPG